MKNVQDAKIGIVGAGAMGQGIAQIAAVAGLEVRLMDIDTAASARAIAAIGAMLDKLAAKGKLTSEQAQAALRRIQPVDSVGGLSDCDLVIEAIVEKLEVKRSLFGQLEEVVRDDAVLVSNTSSLSITAIAAGCRHPERVAGFSLLQPGSAHESGGSGARPAYQRRHHRLARLARRATRTYAPSVAATCRASS